MSDFSKPGRFNAFSTPFEKSRDYISGYTAGVACAMQESEAGTPGIVETLQSALKKKELEVKRLKVEREEIKEIIRSSLKEVIEELIPKPLL